MLHALQNAHRGGPSSGSGEQTRGPGRLRSARRIAGARRAAELLRALCDDSSVTRVSISDALDIDRTACREMLGGLRPLLAGDILNMPADLRGAWCAVASVGDDERPMRLPQEVEASRVLELAFEAFRARTEAPEQYRERRFALHALLTRCMRAS